MVYIARIDRYRQQCPRRQSDHSARYQFRDKTTAKPEPVWENSYEEDAHDKQLPDYPAGNYRNQQLT